MTYPIFPPFPIYTDTDGTPLEDGYLYFGVAGVNPITNPVLVYWDRALTIPAPNPVRTINGYPSRSGSPGVVYTAGDSSIIVKNKNGAFVYGAANSVSYNSLASMLAAATGAGLIGYQLYGSNTVLTNLDSTNDEHVSVFRFMTAAEITAVIARDLSKDVSAAVQYAIDWSRDNNCSRLHFPRGRYLLSQEIEIHRDCELLGEGPYTQLYQSADVSCLVFDEAAQGTLGRNIKVRDMNITKAAKTSTTSAIGLYLRGTTSNIWGADLSGLTISKFYAGCRIERPILTKITRCEFEDNFNDGLIILGGGTSVTTENCWGRVNGGYGIRVLGAITYSNFDTFAADGNTLGGHFFGKDGGGLWPYAITITAPGAEGNTGDGLKIEDGENFVINSPYMYLNGGDGMELSGSRGVVVNGGKFLTNTGWQVRASTSGTPKVPSNIVLIGSSLSASGLGRISDTAIVSDVLSPDNSAARFARPLEGLTLLQNGVTVVQGSQDFVSLGVNSQTYHTITQSFTFANVAAAALAGVYAFPIQVPNKSYILDVVSNLTAEFSGGAVATCTFEFGDAGDPDGYVPATNVFTGAGTGYKVTTVAGRGAYLNSAGTPLRYPIFTGARTIQVTIRTTGANTNALTAGAMTLQLGIVTYP